MTTTASRPIDAVDSRGGRRRYQTEGEPLGSGSGGVVYSAKRLPVGENRAADDTRRVAVKITHDPKWIPRLQDEAKLLHRLQSDEKMLMEVSGGGVYRPVRILSGPHPLKIDDSYGSQAIELEYLDGPTLAQWFERDWLPGEAPEPETVLDEVLVIAEQLAEALVQIEALGDKGLLHRDIKPANIMRTSRGLRLFDFNVSREIAQSSMTMHVGTGQYVAPENEQGTRYGVAADLYSVGVILWEIVHRRSFNRHLDTGVDPWKFELFWPTSTVEDYPDEIREALRDLLCALIADASCRPCSARELLDTVRTTRRERQAATASVDPFPDIDLISLLSELRPSGLVAVVTDTIGRLPRQDLQGFLRARMQVEDPLEDWLLHEIEAAASGPGSAPVLYMLAGNAGDGKSHLLFHLLRGRLASRPEILGRVRAITDATHALRPEGSQRDRLSEFFAPFADDEPSQDDRVHVIAMNTGMVIRFFEGEQDRHRFAGLYTELQRQLGLRRPAAGEGPSPWKVEVVNLDLRDLLNPQVGCETSFAERLLDRLDPDAPDGIPAAKWAACQECAALAMCPVAFNLRALQMPAARQALLDTLRRVSLDADVHLSPRNLWAFLYRLITGGVERYDLPKHALLDGSCEKCRAQVEAGDGQWLLAGQLTELLFQQESSGTPWSALARHDPAFSSAQPIDILHTRLSIKTELDNDPELLHQLGGQGRSLAGLALDTLTSLLPQDATFVGRRRNAAVRRQVFFHPPTFDAWREQDGAGSFMVLLAAYDAYSRFQGEPGELDETSRGQLMELRELVQEVFRHGHGREVAGDAYLRVSQPNARARSELLIRADRTALGRIFNVTKIVASDIHVLAHRGRSSLLNLLGYRPRQVTLDILGVRLTVDIELYDFLHRVGEGQKPSVRDLSQFQALLFVGERVGNKLAHSQQASEVYVWDASRNKLYCLGKDDFDQARMNTAR